MHPLSHVDHKKKEGLEGVKWAQEFKFPPFHRNFSVHITEKLQLLRAEILRKLKT